MNGIVDDLMTGLSALALGAALGLVFFGGLWLTLQRLPRSSNPFLLTMGSLAVRTAVVLAGFWILTHGEPLPVIAALMGFIAVQMLMTFHTAFQNRTSRRNPSR